MSARWIIAAAALVIGYGVHAIAQVRTDTRPPVTPVGSSSSNGISFAWFYDPADRSVFVCRAGAADGVDCKARTTLP
jgi:hypothetical protein